MSNPAIRLLCETKIGNMTLRIEDNLGESIHVHLGVLRLELTIAEYRYVTDVVARAAGEILAEIGLDFDKIDSTAFLWGWTDSIMHIESSQIVNVALKDLLSSYTYDDQDSKQSTELVGSLEKGRIYQALCGYTGQLDNYQQVNYGSESNRDRLHRVFESVKQNGYPCGGHYIVVNQNYMIYDGDHRAASLYYLYGGDYEIPVIMFFERGKACRKLSRDDIDEINLCRLGKTITARGLSSLQTKKKEGDVCISLNGLKSYLDNEGIPFVETDEMLFDVAYGGKIVYEVIVPSSVLLTVVRHLDAVSERVNDTFRTYQFLYSLDVPRVYRLSDGIVSVATCLFCKSLYENALMPLDGLIQEKLWVESGTHQMSVDVQFVYLLTKRIMARQEFNERDIAFLASHTYLLADEWTQRALQREFFGFTGRLAELVRCGAFHQIAVEMERYSNY